MTLINIQTPDDWHLHFRDGDMLNETVPATARCFKRAIVMPNLVPPVTNAKMVEEYRQRILDACKSYFCISFYVLYTINVFQKLPSYIQCS